MQLTEKDIARFWSHVDKTPGFGPKGDCWRWTCKPTTTGYGRMSIAGRSTRSHRISFQIHFGTPALPVLHRCDMRLCVNPDHLFEGTLADNNRDCREKGRHGVPRGEKHPLSKLTREDVLTIRALRASGEKVQTIANRFDLSASTVSYIAGRKRWAHVA